MEHQRPPRRGYARPPAAGRRHVPASSLHPAIWIVVGAMVLIECVLALADARMLPASLSRWVVYEHFAYFDTLFEQAVQGFGIEPQFVWSLFSHAFLHGGFLHLALNGAALLGLGHAITREAGIWATAWLFVLIAPVGALSFSVVTDSFAPLVGASGVVFGFLGVITAWQERWLAARGAPRRVIWARVLGVVILNLIMAFGFGGMQIAWEAHLGGFAGGWAFAYLFRPKHGHDRDPWRT